MPTVSDNLNLVNQRIASAAQSSGRPANEVKLVAVAKTATSADLQEAFGAGQRLFGHNRVQALEEHRQVLPDAEWHLLGPLQGKKVRRGVAACNIYQALADSKTADRIHRVLLGSNKQLDVLIQVNVRPEDGRNGLALEDVEAFISKMSCCHTIKVAGLMNLAVANASGNQLHADFAQVRRCCETLQTRGLLPANPVLSMGMSNDFEIAIAEGANLVRVGRAIFPASS
jgi:hypothetical protein